MPSKRLKSMRASCAKVTYEINDTDEVGKTIPPVKLKNPRIFRPFEYLVGMFGLPSGKDIDVTAFVAITYTVMFGIMFGDFGQGVVLGIAGFFDVEAQGHADRKNPCSLWCVGLCVRPSLWRVLRV